MVTIVNQIMELIVKRILIDSSLCKENQETRAIPDHKLDFSFILWKIFFHGSATASNKN